MRTSNRIHMRPRTPRKEKHEPETPERTTVSTSKPARSDSKPAKSATRSASKPVRSASKPASLIDVPGLRAAAVAISVLLVLLAMLWIHVVASYDQATGRSQEDGDRQAAVWDDGELTIERRSNLSLAEFIAKYDGKRPVIIIDILQNWKAANWSKDFFAQNYGDQKMFMKAVQGTIDQAESFAVKVDVFSKHIDEGKPLLWTYVEDELFIQTHPELKEHLQNPVYLKEDFFQLLPKEVQPWNAMLLWGTAYSRSSLHIDPYNWTGTNAVFYGKKMWKLYPPGQDEFLYVYQNRRCNFPLDCFKYNSAVDAFVPDFVRFPLFAQARALSFTQHAGELLVIPSGWFHQAFNPEESIAVSSQVMNSQNYKICLEEIFKAGEVDRSRLHPHFNDLSPADQVMAVARLIPEYVLKKGKKLTEDLLKQLQ